MAVTKVLARKEKSMVLSEMRSAPYLSFSAFKNTADFDKRLNVGGSSTLSYFYSNVSSDHIKSVVTSVNSPGWYTKKSVRVAWIPKKHPLRPPVKPTLTIHKKPVLRLKGRPADKAFRPFRPWPGIKESTRLLLTYQAERNYSAYLDKRAKRYNNYVARAYRSYDIVLSRWKVKCDRSSDRYALLMERYEIRLQKYLQLLKLSKDGYVRMKRVSARRTITQRNPYTRVITTDYGVTGCVYSYTRNFSRTSYGSDVNGQYIATREVAILSDHSWKGSFGYYSVPTVRTSSVAACESQLLAKLKRKRDDQVAHIGNIIAERAKTFSMFRDLLMRFIQFKKNPIKVISDIMKMSPSSLSKTISNDFLAFQFGLRPLMQDAYNAFEAIASKSQTFPDKMVIRARGIAADSDLQTVGGYPHFEVGARIHNGAWCGSTIHQIDTVTTISYVLEYQVTNGALSALQKFGLVNPAEIAWEVMPWSFVIDWFLPIGDYIRSLSAPSALTFSGGTKTVTTYSRYNSKCVYDASKQLGIVAQIEEGFLSGSYSVETKTRTVLTSAPCELPGVDFKNPLSAYHIAEAIALLIQRAR